MVSFLGVMYSLLTVEEPSLPMVARGVVTSLEDAEMTSGAATGGKDGGVPAIGVLWTDACLEAELSVTVAPGLGVGGSDVFSRGKRGDC